jgi:glycosyltransferase involved in cell wall biosynthesis
MIQTFFMRIGFISTRFCGTDGVSLESSKWAQVLCSMGHEVFFCAGELGGFASSGTLIPKVHFAHEAIRSISKRAFAGADPGTTCSLVDEIYQIADEMQKPLREFVSSHRLDLIIVQNALAIPMNLPLGVCLARLIGELGLPTIAHHHDFYWERSRYQSGAILDLLDSTFPPDLPNILHVTINTLAQRRLEARRGIKSLVIPNVLDFASPSPGIDDYNCDLRQAIGLASDALFVLQPTRVVRRKGIEMAIEFVRYLGRQNVHLIISHSAGDEGIDYWHWLKREAELMEVDLKLIDRLVAPERSRIGDKKTYALWDLYPHADLVTYPSLYEGFGNALLEAIYFKRLVVVNCYPVYNSDIKPLGFNFIELNGYVSKQAVEEARALLNDPTQVLSIAEANYAIAREHFSFEVLEGKFKRLLSQL